MVAGLRFIVLLRQGKQSSPRGPLGAAEAGVVACALAVSSTEASAGPAPGGSSRARLGRLVRHTGVLLLPERLWAAHRV